MSARSIYFRGQADACRQHANQVMDAETQEQLRELADKFIARALESKAKVRPGQTYPDPASCRLRLSVPYRRKSRTESGRSCG
jgi:hypothetical protein